MGRPLHEGSDLGRERREQTVAVEHECTRKGHRPGPTVRHGGRVLAEPPEQAGVTIRPDQDLGRVERWAGVDASAGRDDEPLADQGADEPDDVRRRTAVDGDQQHIGAVHLYDLRALPHVTEEPVVADEIACRQERLGLVPDRPIRRSVLQDHAAGGRSGADDHPPARAVVPDGRVSKAGDRDARGAAVDHR